MQAISSRSIILAARLECWILFISNSTLQVGQVLLHFLERKKFKKLKFSLHFLVPCLVISILSFKYLLFADTLVTENMSILAHWYFTTPWDGKTNWTIQLLL